MKFFVSDMYDAYATVHRRFFPSSVHVIDLFHIITQLTNAVNRIRTIAMNNEEDKKNMYYRFMKTHWNQFLCRKERIKNVFYTPKDQERSFHYTDMVFDCAKRHPELLNAYNILQDLFHYHQVDTYQEALDFISYISQRLISSGNALLVSVGMTYLKWKHGIASSFARSQNSIHITNAIAENMNNHLKTILKAAYGYNNFDRFRKRALLILTYGKTE